MHRVLGGVAVHDRAVTRRRECEVLGLLVAARGRPVAVERILDEVWGTDAGRAAVQVAVSRLRSLLDPDRSGPSAIETTAVGYRLVTAAEVDVWACEDLAEQARAARAAADRIVLGTRAEGLWVGEPYAGCRAASLRAEATRLSDLRVTVQESRAEALLELGHPAAAVRLIAPVAPAHPYREQLWALLARGHYACARQADALATLAALRARLADDLGVDPSSVVRTLEQAILRQDPALSATSPTRSVPAPHGRAGLGHRCRAYVVRHTPLAHGSDRGMMAG